MQVVLLVAILSVRTACPQLGQAGTESEEVTES